MLVLPRIEWHLDGYYEIDELEARKYFISCHAPGFEVPETVIADPDANESLVIDFSLIPVNQQN